MGILPKSRKDIGGKIRVANTATKRNLSHLKRNLEKIYPASEPSTIHTAVIDRDITILFSA